MTPNVSIYDTDRCQQRLSLIFLDFLETSDGLTFGFENLWKVDCDGR